MTRRELEYNVLHEFVHKHHNEMLHYCRIITHDYISKLQNEDFGKLVVSYPELLGEAVRSDENIGWLVDSIADHTAYNVIARLLGKWLNA